VLCCKSVIGAIAITAMFLLTACVTPDNAGPPTIDTGAGRFLYKDPATATGKSLWVWTYRPKSFTADSPIVFVMHGVKRNADIYRNNWITLADYHGFLIVAPEFSRDDFPGSWHYNLGNVMHRADSNGTLAANAERYWSFPIIDRVFDKVRDLTKTKRTSFSLFGHSAGGQFVHRYMTFTGGSRVDLAIAANPGWYTMTAREEKFPYGLGGTKVTDDDLRRFFSRHLIVLLGEDDTQRGTYLRTTAEADRQGANRLERGKTYFDDAKRNAQALGMPFNWKLQTVPSVGHKNAGMAGPAAALIKKSAAAP
jgi:pimeloyl-ACP methyl ester carboxylesterase